MRKSIATPDILFSPSLEHGAILAAAVLNNRRAVEMSVYVVRAFVRLRELRISFNRSGSFWPTKFPCFQCSGGRFESKR